ncbi:MAG: site-specific DNA-methyltransferase [Atribacterota bacterium]|nr:site-specific DNA-methyltransferase [Atribacterota bacterium]
MDKLNDKSVHLVVTSPPYWQLKDYGVREQIGFDDSYENYINHLNLVWKECYRVLKPGCRMVINIGDQFARAVYYGRYKVIPIRTEIIKFAEALGFDYMGSIIWQKKTTMNTTGGATVMGSYPYPRNGIIEIDYEFILIFKKPGKISNPEKEIKEKSKLTPEEWKEYFISHWYFAGEKQNKHLAMFPEELPKRIIKMFTFVGDTVLDPFLGSGTTSLAAKKLNRNSVGYEINKDFLPIIKNKLCIHQPSFLLTHDWEIIKQEISSMDWADEINKLPYIFEDPVRFDKKIDQRTLQFGSIINKDSVKNNNYHKVTDVITPEKLIIDNKLKIKLLGIKEKKEKKEEAINYLKNKTNGQSVFLKFDEVKYDIDDNLLAYVYLKNKTFLNAHLIKNNLVDVDTKVEYRNKNKFLKYKLGVQDG